ncbi:T9SS type A sorting domain-containing protein [Flavilitoribacter nigricans]|uniref:Secretion system C-terminal sorting domain-containing protein n=1 Tax=Flavilitoribacter nigricans (strain ATCC 23147 / DSM 23189 / NBRC 102662 / NCIMB 1420 / SS-2) TaxID=1122177 RepID=A0A2D0NFB9_FLAN2|nr:hypothetical protein CRP01_11825 [Flavilitoribacter nigricans DSM 23189 = NBRC 102662]
MFDQQFPTSLVAPVREVVTVRLFPNPSRENLSISVENGDIIQIQLFNYLGQLQLHQTFAPANQTSVDISSLPSGLFIALVTDQNRRQHLLRFTKN